MEGPTSPPVVHDQLSSEASDQTEPINSMLPPQLPVVDQSVASRIVNVTGPSLKSVSKQRRVQNINCEQCDKTFKVESYFWSRSLM